MPRLDDALRELAEPLAVSQGVEFLTVEVGREHGRRFVRVVLDKDGGLTLDDCERFHLAFGEILDRLDPVPGPYRLEVSSPGEKRPLGKEEDFRRFVGREVRVNRKEPGSRPVVGIIRGVRDGLVEISRSDREPVLVPLGDISRARLTGR